MAAAAATAQIHSTSQASTQVMPGSSSSSSASTSRQNSVKKAFKSGSPQDKVFLQFPLPAPSPRRQRCLSCSDNYLDLSLDESGGDNGLPDVIVTKRNRSDSVCNRILEEEESGTVKYFCRSRGHGFISSEKDPEEELFMHISDIESEFVPRKGDKVSYRMCPIPPRFDRFQAVHVHIVELSQEDERPRSRWETPETPEDIEADRSIKALPYDV